MEKLDERIRKIKESKEWRQEYMTLLIKEQEKFEQGMIKQINALKK